MKRKNKIVYPEIERRMKLMRYSSMALSKIVNMPNTTLNDKLTGRTSITLDEAYLIKRALAPDTSINELFVHEADADNPA